MHFVFFIERREIIIVIVCKKRYCCRSGLYSTLHHLTAIDDTIFPLLSFSSCRAIVVSNQCRWTLTSPHGVGQMDADLLSWSWMGWVVADVLW